MQINNIQSSFDQIYFDHNFLVMIESHLTYLKTVGNVRLTEVSNHQNYKFEGDLFGLLDDLHVPKNFHYITARVNGYENSADFQGDKQYLLLPDGNEIEQLKTIYQTKNNL